MHFGLTSAEYMMMRSGLTPMAISPLLQQESLPTLTLAEPLPVTKQLLLSVDPFAIIPEASLCPPGQLFSKSGCYTPSTEGGMPVPQQGNAYTAAMKAQVDEVLDLGDSFFDKVPPWAIWGAIAGTVGLVIYRQKHAATLQGYRRRRRRRR